MGDPGNEVGKAFANLRSGVLFYRGGKEPTAKKKDASSQVRHLLSACMSR